MIEVGVRTLDDIGKPVDGHTKLPVEVGGAAIDTAVELTDVLSKSDVFTNCIATSVLRYALIDSSVELDGLRRMQPTDVRVRLDNHHDAVAAIQAALTAAIDASPTQMP